MRAYIIRDGNASTWRPFRTAEGGGFCVNVKGGDFREYVVERVAGGDVYGHVTERSAKPAGWGNTALAQAALASTAKAPATKPGKGGKGKASAASSSDPLAGMSKAQLEALLTAIAARLAS